VRDVTALARYQSQNDAVAIADDAGRITTKGPGESAILVSYGGEVKTANVLVPFPGLTPRPPSLIRSFVAGKGVPVSRNVTAKTRRPRESAGATGTPFPATKERIREGGRGVRPNYVDVHVNAKLAQLRLVRPARRQTASFYAAFTWMSSLLCPRPGDARVSGGQVAGQARQTGGSAARPPGVH
jgi:hypothetical protein